MYHLKVYFVAGLLICADASATIAVASQQAKTDQTLRLKADLVQIRAVVTDKHGQIIDNLTREDFELLENDVQQQVSFFALERVGNNGPTTPVMPRDGDRPAVEQTKSPSKSPSSRATRAVVLFVDTLHLSLSNLMLVKQTLRNFVDTQMTSQDLVAVVPSDGSLGLLSQFSADRQMLHHAIEKLASRTAERRSFFTPFLASEVLRDEPEAKRLAAKIIEAEDGFKVKAVDLAGTGGNDLAEAYARQKATMILAEEANLRSISLSSLKAVAERLAELPGQRMIALFSDGFTLKGPQGEPSPYDLRPVISRAVRSGVLIYSFDARGLEPNPMFDVSAGNIYANSASTTWMFNYASRSTTDLEDGLNALAADTGGKVYFNTNDISGALGKSLDENRVYYELAYYPADTTNQTKFRRVAVRVKGHSDYIVKAQRGYIPIESPKSKAAETPQQRFTEALASPLPLMGIKLSASAHFFAVETEGQAVRYLVRIDGSDLSYREQAGRLNVEFEVATVVLDQSGKKVDGFAEVVRANLTKDRADLARRNGYNYSKRLSLKPGLYQFRTAVRESDGERIGSASAWVDVPDLTKGKLATSSLVLRYDLNETQPRSGESLRLYAADGSESYKRNEFLVYQLMLYNAQTADEPEISMKLDIYQRGRPVYEGPWQAISPNVVARLKRSIELGGQIKLALPSGIYEMRLSLRDQRVKQIARVAAVFAVT